MMGIASRVITPWTSYLLKVGRRGVWDHNIRASVVRIGCWGMLYHKSIGQY